MSKCREAFEDLYDKQDLVRSIANPEFYADLEVTRAWRYWQAAWNAAESAVLEAQGKQEPVAWLARGIHGGKAIAAKLHDYKQDADNTASVFLKHYGAAETVPLYAAPVVQPDMVKDAERYRWLRDESQVSDWDKLNEAPYPNWDDIIDAMIAAAEEEGK